MIFLINYNNGQQIWLFQKMLGPDSVILDNSTLYILKMLSILLHHIKFMNNNPLYIVNEHEKRGLSHCISYINFVIDTSSRAYFKDDLMLIKDWIKNKAFRAIVSIQFLIYIKFSLK